MALDFLYIATIPVKVAIDGATLRRATVGKVTRAFDSTARSTLRTGKREWSITTIPLLVTDADALVAAAPNGARVAVRGHLVASNPATTITCVIEYGDEPLKRDRTQAVGHRRALAFTLREV